MAPDPLPGNPPPATPPEPNPPAPTPPGQKPPVPDAVARQIDALKKQKELLDAQKQLVDAQTALEASKRAQTTGAAATEQIAATRAATDLATAQLAAFKAALGEVPGTGLTGDVQFKNDRVGDLEAALLSARALGDAAAVIAARIKAKVPSGATITAVPATDVPAFQALLAYRTQHALVRTAMHQAIQASEQLAEPAGAAVPIVGAAGVALDAASKLAGFFRSDFAVGGSVVSLDDAAAVNEVAGLLCTDYSVVLPGLFAPAALMAAGEGVITQVAALATSNQEAERRVDEHEVIVTSLTSAAAAETDAARKREITERLTKQQSAVDSLRAAVGLFALWMAKLSTADDKGATSLATIAKEEAIVAGLLTGHLLTVKVQKAGGGFFVKKTLWAVLGRLPLFHMGGVSVTFALMDGPSGQVLAAGTVPVYGGFVKSSKLAAMLSRPEPTPLRVRERRQEASPTESGSPVADEARERLNG